MVSRCLGFLASWFWIYCLLGFLIVWFLVFLFLGFLVSKFVGFEVSWFLGFQVYWFLGLKVDWFLSVLVSEFQRFKNNICLNIWIPHYPVSISCFWIDTDPICKILKKFLGRASKILGAGLFEHIPEHRFPCFDISQNNVKIDLGVSLVFLFRYLGVSQIKNNRFGESWSRPPGPRTIQMRGFRVFQ